MSAGRPPGPATTRPRSGLTGRADSFRFAFQGIGRLFRSQANARIHLAAAALVLILAAALDLPRQDWAILILTIGLVLAAEALNSGLEALVDLVSPDPHPLAGAAKDLAAGGVLLAALAAALVGLLVLGPPLWARLGPS